MSDEKDQEQTEEVKKTRRHKHAYVIQTPGPNGEWLDAKMSEVVTKLADARNAVRDSGITGIVRIAKVMYQGEVKLKTRPTVLFG